MHVTSTQRGRACIGDRQCVFSPGFTEKTRTGYWGKCRCAKLCTRKYGSGIHGKWGLTCVHSPPSQVELPKVVAALKRAAGDSRCRGLVTYVGARENLGGLATVQVRCAGVSNWLAGADSAICPFSVLDNDVVLTWLCFPPKHGTASNLTRLNLTRSFLSPPIRWSLVVSPCRRCATPSQTSAFIWQLRRQAAAQAAAAAAARRAPPSPPPWPSRPASARRAAAAWCRTCWRARVTGCTCSPRVGEGGGRVGGCGWERGNREGERDGAHYCVVAVSYGLVETW